MGTLPVSVELTGFLAREVSAFVENEAGWQVVAAGGPPAPLLTLVPQPRPGISCVVVVAGVPSADDVRQALRAGALDVIGWPDDRSRLLQLPAELHNAPAVGDGPPVLSVGGVAGGVGTSTVTLAVAGLLAWAGRQTVVVGGPDLLALCGVPNWNGPGARELAALQPAGAAAELEALAMPVAGMERLSTLAGDPAGLDVRGWPVDAVVHDRREVMLHAGATAHVDLLVGRPDGTLRRATAAPHTRILVVGDGPLDRAGVQRALGRRPSAWLPRSARVARAGLVGRVPSSLPASWLRSLRACLPGMRS